jgi:hypothetical protein
MKKVLNPKRLMPDRKVIYRGITGAVHPVYSFLAVADNIGENIITSVF